MLSAYYKSPNHDFNLICGDTFELLPKFKFQFDMIFADPPYFLSSGGISVQSGKVVCVDKGDWDKSMSQDKINFFNVIADNTACKTADRLLVLTRHRVIVKLHL